MSKLSYEDVINRDGKYIFSPVGTSMMPLLRQKRDTVLVEKPTARLNKHDVALYKRKSGEYVLHRVMKVEENSYVFCGDNQFVLEHGVKEEQILAVMTAFWRDNKFHSIEDKSYRFYTKLWCFSLVLRRVLLFLVRILNSIRRRLKK